ncbi:SURF1 family protein [Solimonas sp. K1W22B-7]|uniref:SURF1 family protein n=1 Tax=Solimonas sp. K1W22B-7 TaxID=2303331 RepID=UPI000E333BF0|nr:SURF1 family protein [Solimonas sp. K1W22B-7]AXQ31381.1 SURF1 family protein [Solimonas sp. K1W22B-7]
MSHRAAPRSTASLVLLGIVGLALFAGLVALGSWQVQRRAWKLDLIERVDQRLRAAPVAAPGPADWPAINRGDEYRRVFVEGAFLHELETCTQAATKLGAGCWVMTPLRQADGSLVLVNRGFVGPERRDPAARTAGQRTGPQRIDGLLRPSEPGGGFLRHNDPAANRWHSRDVAAIAAARGLPAGQVAPYFIDAAATVEGGPVGGLTVIRFPNSHLVYALTWYGLALMLAGGLFLVGRREWRLRH